MRTLRLVGLAWVTLLLNDCREPPCGDGDLDIVDGEECDNGSENSNTLPNACRTDCKYAWCGDDITDDGEECDDGLENSDDDANACRTNCKHAWCGDGVTDTGEQCDMGDKNSDTDEKIPCSLFCDLKWWCGDGVKDYGEQCDDGYTDACGACNDTCTAAGTGSMGACGDGILCEEADETCDDGNVTNEGNGCDDA